MHPAVNEPLLSQPADKAASRPLKAARLGFVGAGWIGRNRMQAIHRSGLAEVVGVVDPCPEMRRQAGEAISGVTAFPGLDDMLEAGLDGVVIATPNALHATHCLRALEAGTAVFCQKPLGRTAGETREIIEAARTADRLLAIDLSYRWLDGAQHVARLCRQGALGRIFAVEMVFHNAYGPDKSWFYDWRMSGGGCLIDLGVHLVDLALWILDFPPVTRASGRLFAKGAPIRGRQGVVEDFARAQLDLATGATVDVTCSWRASAGKEAAISAWFHGTQGAACISNIEGSFYRFKTELCRGTQRESLVVEGEEWGGRAAVDWVRRLLVDPGFDPEVTTLYEVAAVLDEIYASAGESKGAQPAVV